MSATGSIKRIAITGAAGRLGQELQAHFNTSARFELVLLDRAQQEASNIVQADLSRFTPDWCDALAEVDAVVHLAGNPGRARTPWPQLAADNVEATLNVLRAAARHGVQRVVFASTLQVMEGYRFAHGPIAWDAPPRPVSPYGETKLLCEMLARFFAEEHGLSTISLRIGSVPGRGAAPTSQWAQWRLSKWLSNEDFCQAVEKAVEATNVTFVTLPLVSDNAGMRWDLSQTRSVLGYAPVGHTPPASPPGLSTRIRSGLGRLHKRLFVPAWRPYLD